VVDENDWKLNEQRLQAPGLVRQASTNSIRTPPPMARQMTSHVVTRWYRAPELILLQRYTTAIDVWSFACILVELLMMLPEANIDRRERGALFPGRSCLPLSPVEDELNTSPNLDQLNVIFSVIGTPTASLNWIDLKDMRDHLASLSPIAPQPLRELYPMAPTSAIELVESILRFEPSRRCTVDQALVHPFFDGMQKRAPIQLAVSPVDSATIDFEHEEVKIAAIRRLIVQEIHFYADRAVPPKRKRADSGSDQSDDPAGPPAGPAAGPAAGRAAGRAASASGSAAAARRGACAGDGEADPLEGGESSAADEGDEGDEGYEGYEGVEEESDRDPDEPTPRNDDHDN